MLYRHREDKLKKILFALLIIISNTTFLQAGGQAETGRSQAASEVEQGQLLPVGALDPANYLDDFKIELNNIRLLYII